MNRVLKLLAAIIPWSMMPDLRSPGVRIPFAASFPQSENTKPRTSSQPLRQFRRNAIATTTRGPSNEKCSFSPLQVITAPSTKLLIPRQLALGHALPHLIFRICRKQSLDSAYDIKENIPSPGKTPTLSSQQSRIFGNWLETGLSFLFCCFFNSC